MLWSMHSFELPAVAGWHVHEPSGPSVSANVLVGNWRRSEAVVDCRCAAPTLLMLVDPVPEARSGSEVVR